MEDKYIVINSNVYRIDKITELKGRKRNKCDDNIKFKINGQDMVFPINKLTLFDSLEDAKYGYALSIVTDTIRYLVYGNPTNKYQGHLSRPLASLSRY